MVTDILAADFSICTSELGAVMVPLKTKNGHGFLLLPSNVDGAVGTI